MGPCPVSIYFAQATLPLLHKYHEKRKTLFVALPTALPGHSWIVRPLKARHFASCNNPRCSKFIRLHYSKQEKFRCASIADDSVHPFPADSFDSPHNISGICHCFRQGSRQDRARGKIDRGNCVRDRTEKKVHYISLHLDHISTTMKGSVRTGSRKLRESKHRSLGRHKEVDAKMTF
jgi:hypothetical protein